MHIFTFVQRFNLTVKKNFWNHEKIVKWRQNAHFRSYIVKTRSLETAIFLDFGRKKIETCGLLQIVGNLSLIKIGGFILPYLSRFFLIVTWSGRGWSTFTQKPLKIGPQIALKSPKMLGFLYKLQRGSTLPSSSWINCVLGYFTCSLAYIKQGRAEKQGEKWKKRCLRPLLISQQPG